MDWTDWCWPGPDQLEVRVSNLAIFPLAEAVAQDEHGAGNGDGMQDHHRQPPPEKVLVIVTGYHQGYHS